MKFKITLLFSVIIMLFIFIKGDVYAQATGRRIVVDHTQMYLFDQIPNSYITAASNLDFIFVDRSVGWNIGLGLNDLQSADSRFNRSRWLSAHYGHGDWSQDVNAFVTANLLDTTGNTPINVDYNNYDYASYMSSYVDVASGTGIVDPNTGFFSRSSTRSGIAELEEFEDNYPNLDLIHATSSLALDAGTYESDTFNFQMRQYAANNGYHLIDIADIESHDQNGNPCYNGSYLAICPEYTTDIGHLPRNAPMGNARAYVAKALWIMLAQVAGWNPGSSTQPSISPTIPQASPTATVTQIPTLTPTATDTLTPTPTPIPGDANNDGNVDGIDYVVWLNNYGHNVAGGFSVGDFDVNGAVDGVDYVVWLNNYSF